MTRVNCGRAGSGSRWLMPAGCVLFGGAVLLAGWLGHQLVTGLIGLVVMAGFGLFIALAGRSETIRGLRGDGRDERFRAMDVQATAFAGLVVGIAIIAGFLYEVASGHSGSPYVGLGVVFGLAYVAAIVAIRLRG